MDLVTFIIPTIGRTTLKNSIDSLLQQTVKEWNAIIIFDGIKNNINIEDDRIKIVEIDKCGKNINNAGLVRNYGISISNSVWIAFLDDDDIISNDYLEIFYREKYKYNFIDLFIFRMYLNGRIVPKLKTDNFYLCDVGISFIMKKSIYDNGLMFINDGAEDYLYLDTIRQNNYKIMILPYVKYFVRKNEIIEDRIEGNRVFINVIHPLITFLGYLFFT